MKILLLALLSLAALANDPGVGTFAEFDFKVEDELGKLKVQITNYDSESEVFTKTTTVKIAGQGMSEDELLYRNRVSIRAQDAEVLKLCTTDAIQGKIVEVTVPAGTFSACRVATDGDVNYLGAVPFGLIKFESSEGYTLELKKFEYK